MQFMAKNTLFPISTKIIQCKLDKDILHYCYIKDTFYKLRFSTIKLD